MLVPHIFEVRDWAKHNESRILLYKDKVLIIDTKSIVIKPDAHNDILDREMAELLWYFRGCSIFCFSLSCVDL